MPRSMTGYGRGEATVGGHRAMVEIRSVNHRYADLSLRLPRRYGALEERLRGMLQQEVARGRVDLHLAVEAVNAAGSDVRVNEALARAYRQALSGLGRSAGLRGRPTLEMVVALPGVLAASETETDPEEAWPAVEQALGEARDQLVGMRQREGYRLYQDVTHRLDRLGQLMDVVQARTPQAAEEQRRRLQERIAELGKGLELDPARLATEVVMAVEKAGITEELVRVASHLQEAHRALAQAGQSGRRLEFIAQEIGRELNTAAAKTADVEVGKLLLDAREELERVREQIQNIE